MTKMAADTNSKATFQGFAAVILWSVTVAFVRSISEQLGPLTGAAATYSASGAVSWAAYSILAGKLAGNSDINPVPLFLIVTGIILFALSCGSSESSRWSAGVLIEITLLGTATLAGYDQKLTKTFEEDVLFDEIGDIFIPRQTKYIITSFAILCDCVSTIIFSKPERSLRSSSARPI